MQRDKNRVGSARTFAVCMVYLQTSVPTVLPQQNVLPLTCSLSTAALTSIAWNYFRHKCFMCVFCHPSFSSLACAVRLVLHGAVSTGCYVARCISTLLHTLPHVSCLSFVMCYMDSIHIVGVHLLMLWCTCPPPTSPACEQVTMNMCCADY